MADVLVVKLNAIFPADRISEIRKEIIRQKESGVVVLPPYCDVLIVPEDIKIRLEEDWYFTN